MREFDSMGDFATHLAGLAVGMYVHEQAALERCLVLIQNTAQMEFGHYQSATGSFPAWPELAESTKERRETLGYTPNDPLLMSGQMRADSGHEVSGLEGVVGSFDPKMPYHEFGTMTIPARPVWGPAALKNRDRIEMYLGAAVVNGLFGGDPIHPALGYGFATDEPAWVK